MITFPNAKINLGLYVERRRPDNYHDISTVFFPIPLTDVLEIIPSTDSRYCLPVKLHSSQPLPLHFVHGHLVCGIPL